MKKIVLTGGGTAGHVTPNIALIPRLQKEGWAVFYIGSYNGIEKKLIEEINIPYYGISSGKLRRYFDIKNFTDPFKVTKGYFEAVKIIKHINPSMVFSKGGFVTVPVILAAKRKKVPTIIHESDITPGLANKIGIPFASKICATFPQTLSHVPQGKGVLTGSPIREELFSGIKSKGFKITGFNNNLPVLLIIGGSLGSIKINEVVRKTIPTILKSFQVIHICGKGHIDPSYTHLDGYIQYEYVKEELSDLLACADIVVSRAGSNTISELLALKKPNILIPLPSTVSRGDQILNANSFKDQGFSFVLEEEQLNKTSLLQGLNEVYYKRVSYIDNMKNTKLNNGVDNIIKLINEISSANK
ncbi:UDP-N-acetylglucosamine-N-acetylmuramylpentapeptide N-acetylglucosamine transferase [Natranaerovirga pectinivora]|uniref:UDP-N-acetylglucosamine--N-acetylmuramyl-(pentapeptide) pyrophosphoryl-undecaprenol N-acetylglucosamine transferase n=1 Tax=Natranaerovirga pectinivora TaxID=682400 RepID=A0A4R3MGY6_9FIRM|nr:undecaprenyldiphospho-muramoylpentapeptide beta-N-acetylglucosaminyltransferase [Natranaerovirga pectinivora]TCT12939.1 UDP-N-acetylglucosamine-N-acetylmuramylpentapeptide N-acetylglucosamine transferase [Natranaerovirga pectinivora]